MDEPLLKIAAAYIRVSDERQDEYSPDSQLKKIREFAAREGCTIPDDYVFYDDGISGRTAKKRDSFNRMISYAKEKDHPFEVIYVWKFSRFARNQEESLVYKNLLRKHGVTVTSVSEPIPEGHFGSLIERIIEWMDEFYSINLGAEVQRGMTEKAGRGEPTCAPPYGYLMRDKMYYPDEQTGAADVVREIFQRYADGDGMREIAISLGQRGVRTKFGNMPEYRWIEYILNNPCYIGKIRWSPDGARSVSKRDYDNDNIMIINGHHEPLISGDLWDRVHVRLDAQKQAYPAHARREQPVEYMLKGLVRCSACGSTMAINGVSGKVKARCLQCCNYSRGSCHTSHSILLPKIEAAAIEALKRAAETKQFTIIPKEPPRKEAPAGIDYDKLIALEKRRLDRAKEAYLAEVDTIEQYAKNKEEINARIQDLINRRDKEIVQEINLDAFADQVLAVIRIIEQDDVTPAAKNEALRTIVDKIVFEKAKGNLAIYFHEI